MNKSASKYKRELKNLTESVYLFLTELDKIMKQPESGERGKKIAKLSNWLDMENDRVKHFIFNIPLNKLHPENKEREN